MIAELKPCPFCGGAPRIATACGEAWIECAACAISTPMGCDIAVEMERWNTRATPAPAPADKPFMYAIADIEGRAVLDEICVAEHPSELELSEEDEGRGWKIVPVYTGPQIEAMREKLSGKAPVTVTVSEAPRFAARPRRTPGGAFIVSLEEDPDGILVMLCDHRRALESACGAGDGWVACSERMPEPRRYVLAWVPSRRMAFQSMFGEGYWTDIGGGRIYEQVTHWMRTPTMEAPTDKSREVNDGKA